MHSYHLIPIKNKLDWFRMDRVFYFQLGKVKKTEAFIDDHYELIERTAQANELTFVYHKYLSKNINKLNEKLPDYEFLKKIDKMDPWEFYQELDSLVFDYYTSEDVYIIRRYDENNLIGWVFHYYSVLDFPYVSLQSLDHIKIGLNSPAKIAHKPTPRAPSDLPHPSTHPKSFFTATYQCSGCNYNGEIYIAKDYDLFNIVFPDEECNFCKQERELISDGDLIFRKDWPDAEGDSWQVQCAYLSEGRGYCKNCEPKNEADYRSLTVGCSKCEENMMFKFRID